MLRSCEAISQASMSACSCCVSTERHMSLRRAWRCGDPFPSGIGGRAPQGEVIARLPLSVGSARMSSTGESLSMPLLTLGEVVETEDAGEGLAALGRHLDQLARRHSGT